MNKRAAITAGILLILFGSLALAYQFFPEAFAFFSWPILIIGTGVIFILAAILSGLGGLAVPGTIIAGIGGIFYFQFMSDTFSSWSYAWTLIVGFVGLGIILSGIIEGNIRSSMGGGLILIVISLAMFFVFGGTFGLQEGVVKLWPIGLIALGLIIMISQLFKKRR